MDDLLIVTKKPGASPIIELFQNCNGLEFLSNVVEGKLEYLQLQNDVVLWKNREGDVLDLPFNVALLEKSVQVDEILGNVVFTGVNSKDEPISLNEEQIDYVFDIVLRSRFKTFHGQKEIVAYYIHMEKMIQG